MMSKKEFADTIATKQVALRTADILIPKVATANSRNYWSLYETNRHSPCRN